ncbi:oxidoreductase [Aureococcus anophagefferens]|nr:oxidoreductase [Aureococcus anophagefferens]
MPLFQRESATTSKRGIAASKSELLARLAEFSAVDDSAYLSEEGFVEARRAAVRQQRRLVRRSDEGSGFLCAPSTRKSSQRHRVWQPDDVRAPWIEYDKASTALLTVTASAAAPATKPRRFARVDPNVPATRRSLLTRQLSASTLPRPVAADVILDDVPDAVDDWTSTSTSPRRCARASASSRPGRRASGGYAHGFESLAVYAEATLGEAECRTWSVEDDRATPMPAYAAVSCDLLAKLSPLLMRGEHGPSSRSSRPRSASRRPGRTRTLELFADETWFDRCLRVERELERLKEDMKLARAGEYAAMHKFLQHTCLTAWIGWHKLRKLRVRQMRARWGRNAIFLRWRRAAREGLLRERAAAAGPPRVRESLLERFRQDKHASMHDRFFDEEEPEELDDDAPVDPMQRLLALNRMKRLHDGRNTRVTRVLRDGGPEVIDKATSTPADWEVRTQKTMIAEAKDKDDHSKNVNLKRALGRTDKVAEMPVEKAVSLIPLIFEELVNYWGPRAYHNLNLDVDWTAPRKRAHKVQVELATNATVRKYGLKTLAVSHLRALCRSVEKLASKNKRLRLFGELFGIVPEEPHGLGDVGAHVALFARLWPEYLARVQSRVETSVHAVLSGSSRLELRALRDAVAVVFKHTAEELVNKLNRLPHTFKKDVRGGMVDADDALAELFARDRWALELAKSRAAQAEMRGCLVLQRNLRRFREAVGLRARQRRLWVDHFEHHATPEGCMEFFDFNAAVVEGTAAPPAEALVMRLYTEWGTVAEEYADKEREGKLIRIARDGAGHERDAPDVTGSDLGRVPLALEIACFVVQKNYIARCWRKRKSKTQNEALEFLRGEKPRWTEASMARLSANLALRRWRRQMIRADPEALFADAHNDAEPAASRSARAHDGRGDAVLRGAAQGARLCINEVHDFEAHYAKHFGDREHVNAETLDMVLTEVAKFCENELAPLNEAGDAEGCTWFAEGGWQGLSFPEKYGGQELPYSYSIFQADMMATANWTWTMYPGLSKGAINTIYSHCTEELKDKYLPPLVSGEWTGTMCLTEPACGSDLAQVATKAVPNGDGSYKITGTKIFISCGDHDMTDNHLVGDDGAVGDFNKTNIGRIEDKMGCHGSSTCEINFDESAGWLIGSENKGLNHMFTFINTSRLGTAMQASRRRSSLQNGLPYAKDRLAMRALDRKNVDREPDKAADPIIAHPDVRRMLLTQKAVAEGGRSMVFECALIVDEMQLATEAGDTAKYEALDDRLGFLTPILKGYLTEMGVEAANLGIQIFGGHGYIKSNKQEQVVRDARIAPVWEGTTQIQALDLLGRKLLKHVAEWYWLTLSIGKKAMKDRDIVGSASVDYLMFAGHVTLAEHWLKMELAADAQLAQGGGGQDPDFYKAKIATARFAFEKILPRARGNVATMLAPSDVTTSLPKGRLLLQAREMRRL